MPVKSSSIGTARPDRSSTFTSTVGVLRASPRISWIRAATDGWSLGMSRSRNRRPTSSSSGYFNTASCRRLTAMMPPPGLTMSTESAASSKRILYRSCDSIRSFVRRATSCSRFSVCWRTCASKAFLAVVSRTNARVNEPPAGSNKTVAWISTSNRLPSFVRNAVSREPRPSLASRLTYSSTAWRHSAGAMSHRHFPNISSCVYPSLLTCTNRPS